MVRSVGWGLGFEVAAVGSAGSSAEDHKVQIKMPNSAGHAFVDRKLAAGRTRVEATRSLKRHLSNVVYRALLADVANKEGSGEDSQAAKVRLEADRTLTGFS